jgi:hypothetical protein
MTHINRYVRSAGQNILQIMKKDHVLNVKDQ